MIRRGAAVLLLAAVLAVGGTGMTSFAEGWSGSGSSWVYYDADGNKVYNAWKKGADGQWRYLDGSGQMAVSAWVDDEYYVDSNGIMLVDKWLKITNDDDAYEWYYFGSSGKKIEDNWKKIDGKWYHFDSDGRMEVGWLEDDMYYTGSDGVMAVGWQRLFPPDDYDEYANKTIPGMDAISDDDGRYWFYFSSSGKKYVPSDGAASDYGTRKIDGYYYCFDDDGILQTGWKEVRSEDGSSIRDYMYFGDDGKAKTGWYSAEPPEDLEGYDGDVEWFYFTNSGRPRAADSDRLSVSDLVKISGKTYLFNEKGNPVYGLRRVYLGSGDDNWTTFYFGTKEKSCVQKGKMKITEDDGTSSTFYFADNGRGYNGVRDGSLYYKGKLQTASDGQKYVCYHVDGNNYVVNSSGKVMKSKKVKNSDGVQLETNGSGILTKADDSTDISSYVTEPEEPLFTED